ncbi:hypothetical protein RGQ13_01710 [Thalassotalea psychrophila]|uniref:Uncharacterized protein n=1 Tax=Thalassotalea psychrophila TaxID=3065647 RepID=A0ABY9TVG3_9GAMM|nr:hypothetical protein RGQ13_01710 [Colwelliaceae bacterium SQ149]
MLDYIWSTKQPGLTVLTEDEYREELKCDDPEIAERAFNKAWEARNFEIEMYWKRATYFWAFIASTFVGYFALVGSDNYQKHDNYAHVDVYIIICIGFVLSYAWLLTNIGSKSWQRHWEVHVDLLEDKFTGPLYKIVHPKETYSVSKINEIVSAVFTAVWLLLGFKYLAEQNLLNVYSSLNNINWFVVVTSVLSVLAVVSMTKGHGRGKFSDRVVKMHKRNVVYASG